MASEKKSSKDLSATAGSNGKDVLPTYETAEKATIHSHTNAVIRAAQVRAQDEVGEEQPPQRRDQILISTRAARDAKHATECPVQVQAI